MHCQEGPPVLKDPAHIPGRKSYIAMKLKLSPKTIYPETTFLLPFNWGGLSRQILQQYVSQSLMINSMIHHRGMQYNFQLLSKMCDKHLGDLLSCPRMLSHSAAEAEGMRGAARPNSDSHPELINCPHPVNCERQFAARQSPLCSPAIHYCNSQCNCMTEGKPPLSGIAWGEV